MSNIKTAYFNIFSILVKKFMINNEKFYLVNFITFGAFGFRSYVGDPFW